MISVPFKYASIAKTLLYVGVFFLLTNVHGYHAETDKKCTTPFCMNNLAAELNEPIGDDESVREYRKGILQQLSKLDLDLGNLAEALQEDHRRLRRATTRQPILKGKSRHCTVSKATLMGIKEEISHALSSETRADEGCDVPLDSESCEDLFKMIQCAIQNLKVDFEEATENKVSLRDLIKLKNRLDALYSKYNQEIEKVRQTLTEENKRKLDAVTAELEAVKNSANNENPTLDIIRSRLIISELSNGKVANAIKHFTDLGQFSDYDKMEKTIEIAYDEYGNLRNFNNIMNFIKGLPWYSHHVISYSTLYEKMAGNNGLGTSKTLLLQRRVNELINKPMDDPNVKTQWKDVLQNLKMKLLSAANEITNSWAHKIRTSYYDQIVDEVKKECEENYVDTHWPQIMEKAYSHSVTNAEAILKFLSRLSCSTASLQCLPALFDLMKKNNDMDSYQLMMLAYQIKKEQDVVTDKGGDAAPYEKLKSNLHPSVADLVWRGGACVVKNDYGEYLYAAGEQFLRDGDRRRVFTWRIHEGSFSEAYWRILPVNDGMEFTLQNNHYNSEYFYAAGQDFVKDDERRNVFTWRPQQGKFSEGYWRIIPQNGGRSFQMFNVHWREYLYADVDSYAYDNDRRSVFTWRPGTKPLRSSWVIDCSVKAG